ncbi:hypothetical protein K3U94_14260 [Mycolicibacter heraklionensis]|uniref:Uncharacterized protein n=1 Tax=Mycolicibacter heraklionensis TaxID=512402 RepID=A0A9X7WL65_9MYCO|nr:hypothetical protein [Mycolicibacter heraklionensis]QZA10331.1 hypothetical protein K3U94_14260 [Mycolicibacter heraklionensis]
MAEVTTGTTASDTGNKSNRVVPLHERAEFVAWLMASCQEQQVPVTVTDPAVIARIAVLLGPASPPRAAGHTRQTGRTRSMSKLRAPGVPGAITA